MNPHTITSFNSVNVWKTNSFGVGVNPHTITSFTKIILNAAFVGAIRENKLTTTSEILETEF